MGVKNLQGIEIFSTGEWNGLTFSDHDLDGIIEAAPHVGFKPACKLGHNPSQPLLKREGWPAAGYVTRLYRAGRKILADLSDIPDKVADLIEKKAYNRVSAELFQNYKQDGKVFPFVLKAIAFLGEDIPAVTNLDEINALYNSANQKYLVFDTNKEVFAMPDKKEKETGGIDAVLNAFNVLSDENKEFFLAAFQNTDFMKKKGDQKQMQTGEKCPMCGSLMEGGKCPKCDEMNKMKAAPEYKAMQAKVEALEKKDKERDETIRVKENEAWMKENSTKILPVEKPYVSFLLDLTTRPETKVLTFSYEGKQISSSDALKKMIELRKTIMFSDAIVNRDIKGENELHELALEKQKAKSDLSYEAAMKAVLKDRPDLKSAHFTARPQ